MKLYATRPLVGRKGNEMDDAEAIKDLTKSINDVISATVDPLFKEIDQLKVENEALKSDIRRLLKEVDELAGDLIKTRQALSGQKEE